MSLPFDHIENLLRTMERLEEHQRRLLALPNPVLETLGRYETLQASLVKSPIASIIEKLTNHHQELLMSPSQRFLQAATAAIEQERLKVDFTGAVAGTAISTIAFTAGLESNISKAILHLSSSPLASVTKQAQRGIEQIFDKLAPESDLTKLYSTILSTNRVNMLEGVLAAVKSETFENLHIQSDGSVVLDGDALTTGDMEQAISELLDRPEDYLRDLSVRLSRLAKPLRLFVVWFLKNALIPILILLYQDYDGEKKFREVQMLLRENNENQRGIQEAIKEQSRGHPKLSVQWRLVTRAVKVRSHPSNRVGVLDSLPPNTMTWYIEKRGEWVCIQYESPRAETTRIGWVYSKYLERLE